MRVFIFKFMVIFLISILACQAGNKVKYPCAQQDKTEISAAIKYFLDHGNSAIAFNQIDIIREQCVNLFSSAIIHPKKQETDDAIVYLQKVDDKWNVLIVGTQFDEGLDKFNIPKKLLDVTKLHD